MRNHKNNFATSVALNNIKKNFVMSSASVVILISCLLLLGSSLLMIFNIHILINNIQDKNEIVAFIDEEYEQEEIDELEEKLGLIENISEIKFTSKEEAMQIMIDGFGSKEESIVDSLKSDNFLRASFTVTLVDLDKYEETYEEIKTIKGIANTRENQIIVETSIRIKDSMTVISIWVICIFLFLALFIISNTVRLAMFTRRVEINIMKFVGATDSFIKRPFLFEGLFIGLSSGIIAFLLEWYFYKSVVLPVLTNMVDIFNPINFNDYIIYIFIAFIASGVLIGMIGSILPMRKYLKV